MVKYSLVFTIKIFTKQLLNAFFNNNTPQFIKRHEFFAEICIKLFYQIYLINLIT